MRDAVGNVFEGTPFDDIKNWITFKNKVALYYMSGVKSCNCRYAINNEHTLVSVVTTRPIKEGEELCVLFGAEHWFHRYYDKKDDKLVGNYLFELLTDDTVFSEWLTKLYK